jgi:hypothetical protein
MKRLLPASLLAAVVAAWPTAAQASCAESPEPSPHRFVGTVVQVEASGRLAHVVRDDGSRVEVHGSTELDDGTATSVDRHFAVGGRYEFHPINASNPFQDNACTTTRQLSGPPLQPGAPDDGDGAPSWLPIDPAAVPAGYAALAGGGVAVLVLLAGAGVMIVRRFRP